MIYPIGERARGAYSGAQSLLRLRSPEKDSGSGEQSVVETLQHTKPPSHVMDASLRGALGRCACTLQNLVSVESPAVRDRIHLILTGSTARSPPRCILYHDGVVDDNNHVRTCPATARHRPLRFLRMAEVMTTLYISSLRN